MSTLLLKNTPPGLHDWLKSEAGFNRRSLNQQILFCLEWCMRSCGDADFRDPVAADFRRFSTNRHSSDRLEIGSKSTFARGAELVRRITAIGRLDDATAEQMKRDVSAQRKAKGRDFDYACFA